MCRETLEAGYSHPKAVVECPVDWECRVKLERIQGHVRSSSLCNLIMRYSRISWARAWSAGAVAILLIVHPF